MDSHSEPSSLLNWFDLSPSAFPFTHARINTIQSRREVLDNKLFFDELLTLGGVDATQLHPPHDAHQLTLLIETLEDMGWDQLKKDCLVYYLLKHWEDGSERQFAQHRLIPAQFAALSDAYYLLDNGNETLPHAITLLCDLRVHPDFVPKILRTISLFPSASAASGLTIRFVRGAKLVLTQQEELETYMSALCQAPNILDAWLFQRTFPEDLNDASMRKKLLTMIFDHCLIPKPQMAPLKSLLGFPFTPYEQSILNEYALHPPPTLPEPSLAILQDLISVRLVHQGRYTEAIRLDKLFISEAAASGRIGGGAVTKAAEQRRETFNGLISVLPEVQRKLLDLQNDQNGQPKTVSASSSGVLESMNGSTANLGESMGDISMSNSMGMSWEEVGPRPSTSNALLSNSVTTLVNSTPSIRSIPLSASTTLRRSGSNSLLRAFAETSSSSFMEGSPSPSGLSKSKSGLRMKSKTTQAIAPAPPFGSPLNNSFLASSVTQRSQMGVPLPEPKGTPSRQRYPLSLGASSSMPQGLPSLAPLPISNHGSGSVTPSKRPRPIQSIEDIADAAAHASASLQRWQDTDAGRDDMDMDLRPSQNREKDETSSTEEEDHRDNDDDDDIVLDPTPSVFLNRRVAAGLARSSMGGAPSKSKQQPQRQASPPEPEPEPAPAPAPPQKSSKSLQLTRSSNKIVMREPSNPRPTRQTQVPGAFPVDPPPTEEPPRTRTTRTRDRASTSEKAETARGNDDDNEDELAPLPPVRKAKAKARTTRRQTRGSSVVTEDGDDSDTSAAAPEGRVRRSTRLSTTVSPDRKKRKPSVEPETLGGDAVSTAPKTGGGTARKSAGSATAGAAAKGKAKAVGPTRSGVMTRRQQEAVGE